MLWLSAVLVLPLQLLRELRYLMLWLSVVLVLQLQLLRELRYLMLWLSAVLVFAASAIGLIDLAAASSSFLVLPPCLRRKAYGFIPVFFDGLI